MFRFTYYVSVEFGTQLSLFIKPPQYLYLGRFVKKTSLFFITIRSYTAKTIDQFHKGLTE